MLIAYLEYIKVLVSRDKCQKVKEHMEKKLVDQRKKSQLKKENETFDY